MLLFTVMDRLPSAEDYNRLRQSIGWRTHPLESVRQALLHSLFGVSAFDREALVGMGRIVGDGRITFYIQDVVVLPEYQGRGIGALLMEHLMNYIEQYAQSNAVIGLMAASGKEAFYERYGFTRRPTEKLGAGMTIFWRKGE